ncbi:kit ligand a isoform X2 [Girardinichthys multiradiatus]|nr:kit ligand a isoform X2 [Girardinichthys multiradiatus]
MTLGVHSATIGKVTNDIDRELPILRQNIPKDYKIPLKYIPKEKGEMCWVKLNVFVLEQSLGDLSKKFGNISSNKDIIKLVIHYLQEERLNIQNNVDMEGLMLDFMCHYREERWDTGKYFDFVNELFRAAENESYSEECEPPPCPTTPVPTKEYSTDQIPKSPSLTTKEESLTHSTDDPPSPLREVVEKSLFSLLFIPLLALIFLLVWKVRSRRNVDHPQPNPGEEDFFTEQMAPPLDGETSEKNVLNICATV